MSESAPVTAEVANATDPEASTRRLVLDLIVADGPISAGELAARLDLTAAAVRRHLAPLEDDRQVAVHAGCPAGPVRRGRPAKRYVVTDQGQEALPVRYSEVARQALRFLASTAGESALTAFAEARAGQQETKLAARMPPPGAVDVLERVSALAEALTLDGYAVTVRPVPGTAVVQLCQGHCPVQEVAREFPQLCEAETRMLSRVLGVHVQRLATLASGGHVCTTSIPTSTRAMSAEGHHA